MKLPSWLVGLSITAGLATAVLVLRIAFIHNPRGEFFDPESGKVEWVYSAYVFGIWSIAGGAVGLVVGAFIRMLTTAARRRPPDRQDRQI